MLLKNLRSLSKHETDLFFKGLRLENNNANIIEDLLLDFEKEIQTYNGWFITRQKQLKKFSTPMANIEATNDAVNIMDKGINFKNAKNSLSMATYPEEKEICIKMYNKAYAEYLHKRQEFIMDLEEDIYSKVASLLQPYLTCITNTLSNTSSQSSVKKKGGRPGYQKFDKLKDIFVDEDVFHIIDEFIRKDNNLTSGTAKSILYVLKTPDYKLLKNIQISTAHFGELLLKEYNERCGFREGKSVMDGKEIHQTIVELKDILGIK